MGRPPKNSLPVTLTFLLQQIGYNIKELRTEKGFTQAELARLAKISITTLNEMETRQFRDVRLSTLSQVAAVLGVPVARLIQVPDLKLTSSDQAQLLKASEAIFKIAKRLQEE